MDCPDCLIVNFQTTSSVIHRTEVNAGRFQTDRTAHDLIHRRKEVWLIVVDLYPLVGMLRREFQRVFCGGSRENCVIGFIPPVVTRIDNTVEANVMEVPNLPDTEVCPHIHCKGQ